jgi:beta-lactamase class A
MTGQRSADRAASRARSLSEERAIGAVAPRRRHPEQARRLIPPPRPSRRFFGPVILVSLVVGCIIALLIPRETPVPTQPVAVVPDAPPNAVTSQAQAVPVQEVQATLAPSAPTPDPAVVNPMLLREAVYAPFRSVHGRFGIVVKDLATGYDVRLNDHYSFQAASLYKLPVMYEVFKLRDAGLFSLSEELTIGPDDASMDLGTLPWPIGTRITIGTALERMVTLSDNSSAFMLTKKSGSWRINDDADGLGLEETHIRGDDLQTSAADMARLLEMIARGQAVSPETSAEMVQLMARQQVRNRIPVLIPPEATVANKTGNWDDSAHDVAIVYGPRSTVVIVFLAEAVTDFDALYEAMSQAARNVYDLANDPAFGSSQNPPLPPSKIASYASPARPPGSAPLTQPSTTGSQQRTTAPSAPTAVVVPAPADRTRSSPPTQSQPSAPAPAAPAVAPAPAPASQPKPALRPAEKPQQQQPPPPTNAAPAGTPAIKPQAPSIFAPPPTKSP